MARKLALVLAISLAACQPSMAAGEEAVRAPVAERQSAEEGGLKVAIFAGGCFWGIEGVFSHVRGVKSAVSGYHGGRSATAKYSTIITGYTKHAESVRVVYDPKIVRYDELLRILFSVGADPTLKDRQGPDVGAHYRSAIVPMNAEQKAVAAAYLKQMGASGIWDAPIVTRIEPFKAFYEAEEYHQDYMARNPNQRYIVRWDKPKVKALQRLYPTHYRSTFLRETS